MVGGIAAGKTTAVHDRLQGYSYLDIDTLQTHPRDWNAPPEASRGCFRHTSGRSCEW